MRLVIVVVALLLGCGSSGGREGATSDAPTFGGPASVVPASDAASIGPASGRTPDASADAPAPDAPAADGSSFEVRAPAADGPARLEVAPVSCGSLVSDEDCRRCGPPPSSVCTQLAPACTGPSPGSFACCAPYGQYCACSPYLDRWGVVVCDPPIPPDAGRIR
jgi:hypothetical protein